MLGAIIGDVCGSVYEGRRRNEKDINRIELFHKDCHPTDDSIMTVAVGKALMDSAGKSDDQIRELVIRSMHYYGSLFPDSGYGGRFRQWLEFAEVNPYNSWGNGSAMRVSAAGWLYDTMEETMHVAELTADVTHNHPEGVKGAKAIATCIWLARKGASKEEIREYVNTHFYRLDFTIDEIRPFYGFDVSCQGSCPQAIEAFLESTDFENAIRLAISIGGDSDTIAAMTGSIAEAYYGIPKEIKKKISDVLVDVVLYKGYTYNNSALAAEVKRFHEQIG
ncbi:MAG: ADP-ribosylglycohydrolase family protein [Mogibacterium sp.]|nr:ADP-ribosylglycohydrolase family protein [Mogibacterium sp.]